MKLLSASKSHNQKNIDKKKTFSQGLIGAFNMKNSMSLFIEDSTVTLARSKGNETTDMDLDEETINNI